MMFASPAEPFTVIRREKPLMKTEPLSNDTSGPEPTGKAVWIARGIGARLLHEAREALPPTLFFFIGFNFIVLTTNLLVAQYLVAVSNFMRDHGGPRCRQGRAGRQ